jgi:starch synthase
VFGELGLPPESFSINGVEFYGKVGFLKAGIFYADKLTTVSPTYAKEIQTPAYGCGLEGLLQARAHDLSGILNGIDETVWNPRTDPFIESHYDADRLRIKALNKKALQRQLGLPVSNAPLFGIVGRLTSQKGFDMILQIAPKLLKRKVSLVFLGRGDSALEEQLRALERDYPGQVVANIGYEEALEHQLHAGCDAVIMPSRFEPCGLVQMYAQRYGAIPIVRRTGGLADTVRNTDDETDSRGTGFMFGEAQPVQLEKTISRTLRHYRKRTHWSALQKNAMHMDFSWDKAAAKYSNVYTGAGVVH